MAIGKKDYKKYIKTVLKDADFELVHARRKTTVKLIHKPTGLKYSIHEHDSAIVDIKRWIKRVKAGQYEHCI